MEWASQVFKASLEGRLFPLLLSLPREHWADRDPDGGDTLLHHAARGDNEDAVVALLQSGLIDVNALRYHGRTAAHVAVLGRPRMVEVLCAAGVDVSVRDATGLAPLDMALSCGYPDCARVLVANRVRLSTVRKHCRCFITPELFALERRVVNCRAVVVALLGLKRRRGDVLRRLDRWVVRECGWAIWATRTEREWELSTGLGLLCAMQ